MGAKPQVRRLERQKLLWNMSPMAQTTAITPGEQALQKLQNRRKRALVAIGLVCLVLLLAMQSRWATAAPRFHGLLQQLGLLMVVLCILGRTWSAMYIGGYKKRELITAGPYSLVRNPLYMFTIIGTAGIGLMAGSLVCALLFAGFAAVVFGYVTRAEETFLANVFGEEFRAYVARVPRFWPRFSGWRDVDELAVRPGPVMRTFLEACLFLAALPLIEIKDYLQAAGWLPVLLSLA
jgi:protein-S-isoprenylcysteine O-methyltransferase Ste14